MIAVDQNIIVLIDVENPKNTKPYSSLVKLCKSNPEFPLYELYRRDRNVFPFYKTIKGKKYLFVKTKINSFSNFLELTNGMIKDAGFAETGPGCFRFEDIQIKQLKDGYIVNDKKIKYVNELKKIFKAKTGSELNIVIN